VLIILWLLPLLTVPFLLRITIMQSIILLDDLQCETLGGGFGGWGKFTSHSFSSVTNNLTQQNTAYNIGGGGASWGYGKGGFGSISSISNLQANSADLLSIVL
jgi:hypothetical protein